MNDVPRLIRTVGPGAGQEVTSVDDEHVHITKTGNRVVAFMKANFIEIDMERRIWSNPTAKFINFDICMPSFNCRQYTVDGHLGNCNEIGADDRLSRHDPRRK